MIRITAIVALFLLAACQTEPEPYDSGLAGYNPDMIQNEQASCEAEGGRFGKGGLSGTFVCYQNTDDANQSCKAATDCEGMCLARSGTCAPVTPFFGCHEILTNSGTRATICID